MKWTGSNCAVGQLSVAVICCALLSAVILSGKSILESEPEIETLLDKVTPLPTESVPANSRFWLLKKAEPPWPLLPPIAVEFGLPVYPVDQNGIFIVDDRAVDYAELATVKSVLQLTQPALSLIESADSGPLLPADASQQGDDAGIKPAGRGHPSNTLWLELITVTNYTATLLVHSPEPGGVYDLFATTNLSPYTDGFNLTNWFWVLRTLPSQTNLTVTNLTAEQCYFMLATTNDTDNGGFSDAFEQLVTHTDPADPADDRFTPLVNIRVIDSVANEQYPTNTAKFKLSRLGGYISWPLELQCSLSGTATPGVDYVLWPATVIGTNVSVLFPPGHTTVELTLTPIQDSQLEGTETATLCLVPSSDYEPEPGGSCATAWILEQYQYTYTTVADFKQGTLFGLDAAQGTGDGQLQFTTNLPPQWPFIAVACSDRGTVVRINTTNGAVLGEYRVTPLGLTYSGDSGPGPQPSQTTVDLFGNVWVANRADDRQIADTNYGSITRIGLIIGQRYSKTNGNYYPDPNGRYVAISNAVYNTCIDRDGDGFICTSRGLADILPWNNGAGVDSEGGVSTADDEAVTEYVRVPTTGTRTIAVDKFNDIWVGGHRETNLHPHLKVNGLTATVVPGSVFYPTNVNNTPYGGYGGVIDRLGNLWSSENQGDTLLWLCPPTNYPPQPNIDWKLLTAPGVSMYGIAVDPLHPYIWQTSGRYVFRWHTNGVAVTNTDGSVKMHYHGHEGSQGLVVDSNGHVWVAHGRLGSTTVGHLDTNGTWLGNVSLTFWGLWAEYFSNVNLAGEPVLTNWESPISFAWTNGWPQSPPVPTNSFSARWTGIVAPQTNGMHVFIVSAEAGAAVRLRVNGTTLIDNWANPTSAPVELAGTIWLSTNVAYDIRLEYAHRLSNQPPQLTLAWQQPNMASPEVIHSERFSWYNGGGATGVSVDAAGKIWVACYDSSTAARIDPNAGPMVITNGVTNYVGLVDMVVDLGDGSFHPEPLNKPAHPYNYSDMTGFNNRIVNPTLQPLKGYWIVIHDSGFYKQLWNKVSWTVSLTNGCAVEVFVRAADERTALSRATFVQVTNGVCFPAIRGRYIEVRLALVRDEPTKQPVLYDLTLYGSSSGFEGEYYLYGGLANEGDDAMFWTDLIGAEPMGYQWFRLYPWETNWVQLTDQTNSYFVITNVDSWVDGTMVSLFFTNGIGESAWLGPDQVVMIPKLVHIPATNYPTSAGPASRYPMTINVFGLPTNFNRVSVTVTLCSLSHSRSADLAILLVSPRGTNVMLMSNVGGTNGVSYATITFRQYALPPSKNDPILPLKGNYVEYRPSNYGQVSQMPQVGPDPPPTHTGLYSANLDDLQYDDPNGLWKLYIYDNVSGAIGYLASSWQLNFDFH